MTVAELRDTIADLPDDMPVVVRAKGDGVTYSTDAMEVRVDVDEDVYGEPTLIVDIAAADISDPDSF